MVTNEIIESREMIKPVTAKTFEIVDMKFTKCSYQVKDKKK